MFGVFLWLGCCLFLGSSYGVGSYSPWMVWPHESLLSYGSRCFLPTIPSWASLFYEIGICFGVSFRILFLVALFMFVFLSFGILTFDTCCVVEVGLTRSYRTLTSPFSAKDACLRGGSPLQRKMPRKKKVVLVSCLVVMLSSLVVLLSYLVVLLSCCPVPGHLGLRVLGILGQASSSQLSSQPDEPLGDQYIVSRRMSAISGLCRAYLGIYRDLSGFPPRFFFRLPNHFWEH